MLAGVNTTFANQGVAALMVSMADASRALERAKAAAEENGMIGPFLEACQDLFAKLRRARMDDTLSSQEVKLSKIILEEEVNFTTSKDLNSLKGRECKRGRNRGLKRRGNGSGEGGTGEKGINRRGQGESKGEGIKSRGQGEGDQGAVVGDSARRVPMVLDADTAALAEKGLTAKRLAAEAEALFGEPVYLPESWQVDLGTLVGHMAQAYENRHKLNTPARVVFACLRRGWKPSKRFASEPWAVLPEWFRKGLETGEMQPEPEPSKYALPEWLEAEEPEEEEQGEGRSASAQADDLDPSLQESADAAGKLSAAQAWQETLVMMREDLGVSVFRRMLEACRPLRYDSGEGVLTVVAQDAREQEILDVRLKVTVDRRLGQVCNAGRQVRFVLAGDEAAVGAEEVCAVATPGA